MPRPARVDKYLRQYLHPAYRNVYEPDLRPKERALFGTENMPGYGNWDSTILLLAQDCGVVSDLLDRIKANHPCPHGYGESVVTNTKLRELQSLYPLPEEVLYGSVLGSLWRRLGTKRGAPPSWSQVCPEYSVPMIRWVASQMSNLRAIGALGFYSWQGIMSAANRTYVSKRALIDEYRQTRDCEGWTDVRIPFCADSTSESRTVRVFAMWHPGAYESYETLGMNRNHLAKFARRT